MTKRFSIRFGVLSLIIQAFAVSSSDASRITDPDQNALGHSTTLSPHTSFYLLVPKFSNQCEVTRVIFDIGSSNIKVKGSIIDRCNNTERATVLLHKIQHDCSLLFSKGLHEQALNKIMTIINGYKSGILPKLQEPVETSAIMTALYRYDAGNGRHSFDVQVAQNTGVPTKVISQQDEGYFGYQSTLHLLNHNAFPEVGDNVRKGDFLSWDVGGGSQQFSVATDHDSITVHGSTLGSSVYHKLVREFIRPEKSNDLFPISDKEIDHAINIAKLHFHYPALNDTIQTSFERNITVFGVGKMYSRSILPLIAAAMKPSGNSPESAPKSCLENPQQSFFTQNEVYCAIHAWKNSTSSDLAFGQACPICVPDKPTQDFTNLLLVRAAMEHFGMEKVYVADINSMDTALLHHNSWGEVPTKPHEITDFNKLIKKHSQTGNLRHPAQEMR